MSRLEGIPGGIVRQVCSSESMLGVISQTGDLYVAASPKLHHSAAGQKPGGLSGSPTSSTDNIPSGSQIMAQFQSFRLARVKGMGPLRRVALGDYHSLAISEDNQVYSWGMNVNDARWLEQDPLHGKSIQNVMAGQLGLGMVTERWLPPTAIKDIQGIPLDIAVGSSHSVLLMEDGKVLTCGNPMCLGRPDTFVFDVLMAVPGLDTIKIGAISCGWDHTLAVATASGAVYAWGLNDHGQLGQPRQCKYAAEPMLVSGSKNIVAVVGGPQHSVCLGATGVVIVWGSNVHGELGIGSDDDRVFEPRFVGAPLENEHTVISASCSRNRTFVLTDTGEVFQAGKFPNKSSSGGMSRSFTRVSIGNKYVGGVAVGLSHEVYLIDQALTHIMAQLMEPRTGSSEAFLRKLLRLFQVAVNNDAAHLINGVQSRVNRLASEEMSNVPRVHCNQTILRFTLQASGSTLSHQIIRVQNMNPYKIECDCWWGLQQGKSDLVSISFSPQTFVIDEGESAFVRIECMLADETTSQRDIQTLCQLSARKLKKKQGSHGGGFASHFFFLDFTIVDKTRARDPELVQHLVETMSTYVPATILQELCVDPTPPSKPKKETLSGAILFIDVSGFTALNERLAKLGPAGPEQVSTHLNRYFGQLIDAVHRHGGDVLKFAGDALICLFGSVGSTEPLQTLVLRAVQCACEVQHSDLKEYDSQQGFRLTLHIGVGCGDVHWLHLGGVEQHYEHVVMGDPLLQLETAVEQSKTGEVVVSKVAYDLICGHVSAAQRGKDNFLVAMVTEPIPVVPRTTVLVTPEMEAGLRCFLPKSILARVDALHISWLAELRRVTVIFVNLTSLTYDPSQEIDLEAINEMLCSMQKIVYRYEGMIRQFIVDDKGTVLIAAFGVPPFGHEDDPVRGIKAAWEIQSALQASNVTSSIGVTTGKVFCGSVGSSKRQEYAMVGDIVNLSARLMNVAKKLNAGIIVDESTKEQTSEQVNYEVLDVVTVKGKKEPIPIAKPTTLKEQQTIDYSYQSDVLDSKTSNLEEVPIVARKAEMGLLQLQVAKLQAMKKTSIASRGSTKTFLLSGVAGIGKTRITNELAKLCRKQNVEYYIGHCKANSNNIASAFGIDSSSNWAEYLPLLNEILPLGLEDNEMCSKLDPDKKHMLTISFMAYLIQARAQEKPVVLIVEDLQWIDESSMELLAAVAAETSAQTKGILIVLSHRNPPQHIYYKQLLQLTGVEELKLMPLSNEDCRSIACSTLKVPLTAWLPELDKALDKAHGNPLFAMEIAFGLRESGAVEIKDGTLVVKKKYKAGTEIPETIEGLIGSRIDQLPSGPQLCLKVASVIGMEFTASLLAAIYPIDSQRNSVAASLKMLVEVGLLERNGPTSPVFRFKNDTVLDVTYARMLFTQRQQLHEKIAVYYEEQQKQNIHNSKPTDVRVTTLALAHHWSRALLNSPDAPVDKIARASSYLLSAAVILKDEERQDEAAKHIIDCEQLAEMLTDSPDAKDAILAQCKQKMDQLVNLKMSTLRGSNLNSNN